MNKSNSNSKADAVNYYSIISGIRPGRSPSIFHKEHRYYWGEFPDPPVYTIYNTTFNKVTPLAHTVDCRKYGQLHYWARIGDRYSPALIVFEFIPPENIFKIKYYFFRGLSVSDPGTSEVVSVKSPDNELVRYCIAGFSKEFLSKKYSFSDLKA